MSRQPESSLVICDALAGSFRADDWGLLKTETTECLIGSGKKGLRHDLELLDTAVDRAKEPRAVWFRFKSCCPVWFRFRHVVTRERLVHSCGERGRTRAPIHHYEGVVWAPPLHYPTTLLPPALPVTPRPAFLLLSRLLLAILLTPHFILRSLHPSPLLYYIPCSSPARLTPRLIPASLPDHFHSNQTLALSLRFCHSLHPLVSPTCFTSSLHHVAFPFASFSYFTFSIHFLASPFASLSVLSPQPFPLASLPYLIHSPQHSALPPRSLPMSRRFTFLASHSCLYSALYSVSFNTRSLFLASVLCFISSLSQAAYFTYVHTLDSFHYFNTPSLFLCFVSLLQLLASPAPLHFLISSTSSLCLSSQFKKVCELSLEVHATALPSRLRPFSARPPSTVPKIARASPSVTPDRCGRVLARDTSHPQTPATLTGPPTEPPPLRCTHLPN
ncbi:hypothetical protein C7M84_020619 [Penaeus vannamei]|uniref:Uncharacterized protein n=1 Tax=Penaeus vannamei TaxID=6689 RepID=A0A3R7PWC6_PENVA|nr:hypothetical protein C7M84_020619 [Penaeus vannamei]